jgi:adenosylcobinamide amidohydrolase
LKCFETVDKGINLCLEENVLALISDKTLNIVSSAIHNGGGIKETKVIVNAQVTDEYGDALLHEDPDAFIVKSFKKLRLKQEFVGMVTYAMVKDFALYSKKDEDIAVTVVATAGCTHAESAGEEIEVQKIAGTINIIVLIDGNPNDSCLVSSILTATEAKTAALTELDLRSKYSGDQATGTVTDAVVVASTRQGQTIIYGGPASKLGQLVANCTRKAVKEAVTKAKVGGYPPNRSIIERLSERHLSVEKIAVEMSKIKSINANEKTITDILNGALNTNPLFASLLIAAAKLDEDFKRGLIPPQINPTAYLGKQFGDLLINQLHETSVKNNENQEENSPTDLSPFLRQALTTLTKNLLSEKRTETLK